MLIKDFSVKVHVHPYGYMYIEDGSITAPNLYLLLSIFYCFLLYIHRKICGTNTHKITIACELCNRTFTAPSSIQCHKTLIHSTKSLSRIKILYFKLFIYYFFCTSLFSYLYSYNFNFYWYILTSLHLLFHLLYLTFLVLPVLLTLVNLLCVGTLLLPYKEVL